jgi:hypothetical protein
MPIEYTDCDKGEAPCIYYTVIEQVAPKGLPAEQRLIDIAEGQVPIEVPPEQRRNIEALVKYELQSALIVHSKHIKDGIDLLTHNKGMKSALMAHMYRSVFVGNAGANYFDIMNGIAEFIRKDDNDFDDGNIQNIIDHLLGPESEPYKQVRDNLHELRHSHGSGDDQSSYVLIAEGKPLYASNYREIAEYLKREKAKSSDAVLLVHGAGNKIDFDLVNNMDVPQGEAAKREFKLRSPRIKVDPGSTIEIRPID